MPLWHKIKLLYYLLFPPVSLPSAEELNKIVKSLHSTKKGLFSTYTFQLKETDDVDMVTLAIQQLRKEFPTVMETLVHERDKLVFFLFLFTVTFCCFIYYIIFTA